MTADKSDGKGVRVLLAGGDGWTDFPAKRADGDDGARPPSHHFSEYLRAFLMAENLVVLAGLGSSRCVLDDHGTPLCPKMQDLWNAASERAGTGAIEKVAAAVNYTIPGGVGDIEALLSQCQMAEQVRPEKEVANFVKAAESVIREKCSFPEAGHSVAVHETFLRRMARGALRKPRLKVFTTNYDLCFERAAANTRFIVVDGFSHAQPQEFDGAYFSVDFVRREESTDTPDFLPNVLHLYKLHGSVDWESSDGRVVRNPSTDRPLLIYPRNSKFEASYAPPFVELMSRFQMALRQPNSALLVVGSGLRDGHIAGPVLSAVRGNIGLRVLVIDLEAESKPSDAVKEITELISLGDTRLGLCAGAFEAFVPLVPDLAAETERERHDERLRKASKR